MAQIESKKKIKTLQAFRAIAVLFIFYTHITASNIIYATCAVSFFVVLSGFLYGIKQQEEKQYLLT